MKVLLFIADIEKKHTLSFASRYLSCFSQKVELHLLCNQPLATGILPTHIVTHTIKNDNILQRIGMIRQIHRLIGTIQPDIIHLFGSWSPTLRLIQYQANRMHIPSIISPMGGLDRSIIQIEFWKKKLPQLILYQYWLIRESYATLAISQQEDEQLKSLAWKRKNGCAVYPVVANKEQEDIFAKDVETFYQKVIDSHSFALLNPEALDAIYTLLMIGSAPKEYIPRVPSEQTLNLRAITPIYWRRILLYAFDEGILDVMKLGIERMQLDIPKFNVEQVARFPSKRHRAIGLLRKDQTNDGKPSQLKKLVNGQEKMLCTMLLNARHEIRNSHITLRQMEDLYHFIRYNDFDEAMIVLMTKQLHCYQDCRRIMQILMDICLLQEGFMPMTPLNDKHTRRMLNNIFKNA